MDHGSSMFGSSWIIMDHQFIMDHGSSMFIGSSWIIMDHHGSWIINAPLRHEFRGGGSWDAAG